MLRETGQLLRQAYGGRPRPQREKEGDTDSPLAQGFLQYAAPAFTRSWELDNHEFHHKYQTNTLEKDAITGLKTIGLAIAELGTWALAGYGGVLEGSLAYHLFGGNKDALELTSIAGLFVNRFLINIPENALVNAVHGVKLGRRK